jgi:low temperature requirement protein LtrA
VTERASWLSHFAPVSALRPRGPGIATRVTNTELFFDLVYVFAIIQLSHFLLEHESWMGALQAATLFAAVWWSWNYTAWATNWLHPDHPAGRALMFVLMGLALVMAIATPEAFGERAGLFAAAYVAMALVRAGYMALVFRGQQMGRNYAQLGAWSALSALFWILGALFEEARLLLWIIAVAVDYAAPFAGFWVPGRGRTPMSSWPLAGLHLLERNQQVFIIALGESVLLLGGTLVGAHLDGGHVIAGLAGFLTIVSLWWIYFVDATERGEHAFAHQGDHTRLARSGLAFAHGIMVGGAIVVAVAIETILAHPDEPAHAPAILFAIFGPALFLIGSALFHRTMAARIPLSYLAAILGLAGVGLAVYVTHASGLVLGLGMLAVLLALAASVQLRNQQAGH